MKKLLLVPAFIMGLAAVSFAGNPKSEGKSDVKSETKAEVKAQQETTTYYVTGGSGSNYTISQTQTKECTQSGSVPCSFTSPNPALGSSIPKSTVDNEDDDIVITDHRTVL